MERSPMHQQVDTLPELTLALIDGFIHRAYDLFSPDLCRQIQRVFIAGCGDSHHAAMNAELAFEQLAGMPCEPQTAMQFSRYAAGFMPATGSKTNLVIGVSVSGQVSRTIEAVSLAQKNGALTAAITGSSNTPLAARAELVFKTAVPALPVELSGQIVPGVRSYFASQLALYVLAIQLGQEREHITKKAANNLRRELANMAVFMEENIAASDPVARHAAEAWIDADNFVFLGSGPSYGTALFCTAKLLEASGDTAVAQDLEEWAHLQYFARQAATPTFIISSGERDQDRALEIAEAARTIGRRLALVAPANSKLAQAESDGFDFPLSGEVRECFSPLLTPIPGMLFAAYRAQLLSEPYFRDFGGGRSSEGGGGISRIRTSHMITDINTEDGF